MLSFRRLNARIVIELYLVCIIQRSVKIARFHLIYRQSGSDPT